MPPGEPLDDSPLPNCPIRDIVLTDRDKQLRPELRRASAMALPRCVVSRCAAAWTESFEGAMSGHQSWALLCRYRCRLLFAEIPKGVDRNSELKQRLHLWETGQISDLICKVLGQQNSGPLRRTARRVQPQTDEQRGKRPCALTARGSISKAMKGLVGGAAQGSADCRRNWTTALIPRSSGIGTHPTAECAEAADCLGRWKAQNGTGHDEGARPEQNRYRFAATRQTVAYERSWPYWRTAGTPGCHRFLRRCRPEETLVSGLDILTIKWATGDLLEECRFLLNTQLVFLKKEKDPRSKQFDDDEWIRTLTEAQEVTTDIPEDRVTCEQQEVDSPKKFGPFRWETSCGKTSRGDSLALSEGEIAALTTSMRQIGVGTQGGAEALAIFHDRWPESKLMRKIAL